jgi:hypothetical protein
MDLTLRKRFELSVSSINGEDMRNIGYMLQSDVFQIGVRHVTVMLTCLIPNSQTKNARHPIKQSAIDLHGETGGR